MLIRIDPQSPEPLFEQISFAVKDRVARGQLRAGDRLPSVRELARELAINPNTVVRAYDELTRDGVVVRRQGAGCFVAESQTTLHDGERRRQLQDAAHRLVTDAFHLDFSAAEVRNALEKALRSVRFDADSEPKTPKRTQKRTSS